MLKLPITIACLVIILMLIGCDYSKVAQDRSDGTRPEDLSDAGSSDDNDSSDDEDTGLFDFVSRVDTYWGDAPDETTRLAIFDDMWGQLAREYACFDTLEIDWDAVRDKYRPQIKSSQSYGRFYQLLSEMIGLLHDSHTVVRSEKISASPLGERPPFFVLADKYSPIGACVTELDDGTLVVYRTEDDNPARLTPGDEILGYDGKHWADLVEEIASWKLPLIGGYGSAKRAERLQWSQSVLANVHLFRELDVLRLETGEIESIPTDALLNTVSRLACTDQLTIDGIETPFLYWPDAVADAFDNPDYTGWTSWGILPGTNIGYIYPYIWFNQGPEEFDRAIEELKDTDGLIIDQRFNGGGWTTTDGTLFSDLPWVRYLFNQDIDPFVFNLTRNLEKPDDYFALNWERIYLTIRIDADESTFYDGPIALLQGPKAGSGGDLFPYLMSYHPKVRRFGRLTKGAFGGIATLWNPVDWHVHDLFFGYTFIQIADANGNLIQGMELLPDEQIWLTKDDIAAGVDTVAKAAIDWVKSQIRLDMQRVRPAENE